MTISQKDLIYWYRHFKSLLSGWSFQEQIQFHYYAIDRLNQEREGRVSK